MRAKTHSGHDHDHGYKRLFSHPQAVEELIRGFLRPEWAEGLDFSTLERVGNEFISDDLRIRRSDVIWRMRRKGGKKEWLYLMLELAGNRVAALFRIETCKDLGDLPRLTRELFRLLPPGEEPELHRTIKILLRAILRRTLPGVTIPKMLDLEDISMLEETAREWRKQYLKEGRKEGRQEGMRELLLHTIERRFGPLPSEQRRRFEAITSPARLKRLADKILTVSTLDEMGI